MSLNRSADRLPSGAEPDESTALKVRSGDLPPATHDEYLPDNPPPRLNWGQKIGGVFYRGLNVIMVSTDGAAMIRYDEKELPPPFDFPTEAAAQLFMDTSFAVVEAATRWQDPFRYLRAAGDGSVLTGTVRESFKKTLPVLPIYGTWIGLSYGRNVLFNDALKNMNGTLLLMLTYLDSPTARATILYLISKPLWELGQKILSCCTWPNPDVAPEDNPDTRWFQKLSEQGVRVFWTVCSGEFIREVMNTAAGGAVINHSLYSMGYGMAAEGFVLDPVHRLTSEAHPFRNADIPCRQRRRGMHNLHEYTDLDRPEHQGVPPTKARQAGGTFLAFGILCMAYGVVMVAWRPIAYAIAGSSQECLDSQNQNITHYTVMRKPHDMDSMTPNQRQNLVTFMENNKYIFPEMAWMNDARVTRSDNACYPDPADMSYETRIGALFLLGGAFITLQNLPTGAIKLAHSISDWCSSRLWSKAPAAPAVPAVVALNDDVDETVRLQPK